MDEFGIYERGITSVVELNMRNLARWVDGVYDNNLLAGTNAVSTNIRGEEGYVVYVSDRRGDRVKAEYLATGVSYASTNGIVDNEDIYGPNNTLDDGEDVIDFGWNSDGTSKKGSLQKDTNELPDSGTVCCTPANGAAVSDSTRLTRSNNVLSWMNPGNHFRRSVRLFDGETLSTTGAGGKLSTDQRHYRRLGKYGLYLGKLQHDRRQQYSGQWLDLEQRRLYGSASSRFDCQRRFFPAFKIMV